jgi:thiosulfate/3-mercaptopyruvate sulfurtransferase
MSRLISTTSLLAKIKNSNKPLKILDSTSPNSPGIRNFKREKIVGAQFLFLQSLSDPNSKFSTTLPPPSVFNYLSQKLQITKEDEIVFYDAEGAFYSPRAFFIFKMYNYENIYLLDGGLTKWKKDKLPIEEVNTVNVDIMKDFDINSKSDTIRRNDLTASFEDIQASSISHSQAPLIIDTRTERAYMSKKIPNSCNFPWTDFFNEERTFKSKEELLEKFKDLKIDISNSNLITSCNVGLTACTPHFILSEIFGNNKIRLYDGSMEEYAEKNGI